LIEAIDRTADAIEWGKEETSDDPNKAIGKGFAVFWKAPAMPPNASSASFLKFNEDGSMNISVSGMELGQGYMTAMAQIAGEVLAVPPTKIRVETPDTDRNPYEWQTVASHVTWSCGNAVHAAAVEAREKHRSRLQAAVERFCHRRARRHGRHLQGWTDRGFRQVHARVHVDPQ
jgi:carbon-monoxide dehydrogenase large subunit